MRMIPGLLAAVALLPAPAGAQAPAPTSTIDGAQRHTLTSSKSRQAYQIDVLRLDSTATKAPAGLLPVIYVLDGNSLFPLAAHVASAMTSFSSRMPGVVVVAIGYPAEPGLSRAENIKNRLSLRIRDFTPPGGAADFLAFINHDLKPFIAARYPVDPVDQALAGHSLGGLFTVFALLTEPASFTRYVALSPSVFWNDNEMIKRAGTFSERFPGMTKRLFVGVGGLETKEFIGEDMIGVARGLVAAFQAQNPAGVEATFRLFDGEGHISVVPGGLTRGLLDVGALR